MKLLGYISVIFINILNKDGSDGHHIVRKLYFFSVSLVDSTIVQTSHLLWAVHYLNMDNAFDHISSNEDRALTFQRDVKLPQAHLCPKFRLQGSALCSECIGSSGM